MKRLIKLKVNGDIYEVAIEPSRTLLEVLRENLQYTGTKKSCETGTCGACTVLINGVPVLSCLVLAFEAEGMDILTIEGISEKGSLHPIQESFIKHGAIQCGHCTPGMIMLVKGLLDKNPMPNRDEIKKALAGNFCRCTGYKKIFEAVEAVSEGK
ncbi:MAG: (2Fe-2S)-binding protein [Candidatus Schekmanbacteria bacterium RIFCSPHIGHO2_02_FULL_38_11]|uniref:(2Fe-2S)-binding protein n=1 Tax=Candidatus Schekmanbacteria bacterium RIFCSPLOWO2_12_FULL_38_15 TaxID=1817883 RepID=A0A1F7SFZ6_9BACT|nr:MAG: (2Fe-2S)-binding protein [Candidatus Schekmanbacteria bacterium GWA2_38_9]OGL49538.1 MAG: (2Fe-2S)-binding protein [Candidatus Schekmanbacteria bacterium RIFCSPLOWO2_02_FULL_38_14]OGL52726.1 MAG: (2Fe-2S)-binding protein [Candidatus Schekmanbacteria bacterium RIFCSPLOWO2_12_FULL_38_15]OGL53956.1 MAG: (2Fe-2S)-binding protein [Candidatus Schekmanbacteria bacterium RIFCSPHIGHO2_02_FULL_38_11]